MRKLLSRSRFLLTLFAGCAVLLAVGSQPLLAQETAGEAAKPYYDKGKEAAQKAYEDTLKRAKELMEKPKQPDPPKKD